MFQQEQLSKALHPVWKLTILLSFLLLGALFSGIVVAFAFLDDFGNLNALSELIQNHPFDAMLVQTISHLCTFLIAPILFITFLEKKNLHTYLGFRVRIRWVFIFYAFVLLFSIQPVLWGAIELGKLLPLGDSLHALLMKNQALNDDVTKILLSDTSTKMLCLQIFTIGFLAALGEEIVFRGIIQKLIYQWSKNIHIAVFTSAFLFSIVHGLMYNFFGIMVIGLLFGYLYYFTGNLWVTIGMHFLNNVSQVLLSYMHKVKMINYDIEADPSFTILQVIVAGIVTILFFYRIYRNRHPDFEKIKTITFDH